MDDEEVIDFNLPPQMQGKAGQYPGSYYNNGAQRKKRV
jgi:hypothetical protein